MLVMLLVTPLVQGVQLVGASSMCETLRCSSKNLILIKEIKTNPWFVVYHSYPAGGVVKVNQCSKVELFCKKKPRSLND